MGKNKCVDNHKKKKDVFVMQLWIVTVLELRKFLKLNAKIIYTVLPSSNLIKSFTFTVREIFQNVDFLWSVFSRVCAESDTTGYDTIIRYDSVHVQENKDQRKPAFWDTSRNVKYSHPRIFFSISLHPLAFSHFYMKKRCAK